MDRPAPIGSSRTLGDGAATRRALVGGGGSSLTLKCARAWCVCVCVCVCVVCVCACAWCACVLVRVQSLPDVEPVDEKEKRVSIAGPGEAEERLRRGAVQCEGLRDVRLRGRHVGVLLRSRDVGYRGCRRPCPAVLDH
jgi:hypothetical protein